MLPGIDKSFVVIICAVIQFIVMSIDKGVRRVQLSTSVCLLHGTRDHSLLEESGHLWVEDKSMSVHKGVIKLPVTDQLHSKQDGLSNFKLTSAAKDFTGTDTAIMVHGTVPLYKRVN